MHREIGSEFWAVPTSPRGGVSFPDQVQWYRSGRCALRAILQQVPGRRAALPSWCCDSMILPFLQAGMEVTFYSAPGPVKDIRADVILVLDYFGFSDSGTEEKPSGAVVIRDVTHSVFSTSGRWDADYYFGSLRKWAGFWTGGFGWRADGCPLPAGEPAEPLYTSLRRQAMEEKSAYIHSQPAGLPRQENKPFLQVFGAAEELLDAGERSCAAHPRDIALAQELDTETIIRCRRRNGAKLLEEFGELALFPRLQEGDCPLFVPIRVPGGKRDALRRYLIGQQIYCPVHWPRSPLHRLTPAQAEIYEEELSLVCDQRYDTDDMERMICAVREFWKG